jgi:hypothetical protein
MKNWRHIFRHAGKLVNNQGMTGYGSLFVMALVILMSVVAFQMIGGTLPTTYNPSPSGAPVMIITPTPEKTHYDLQLLTLNGVTLTPTPPPSAAGTASACSSVSTNTESMILVGSDPGPNQAASASSNIRVWVTDEGAPKVSVGELVNQSSGQVTRGKTSVLDSNSDGNGQYSWEPTLYIYPASSTLFNCNATIASCKPHYPDIIKGVVDNQPSNSSFGGLGGNDIAGPQIDADYTKYENGPGTTAGGGGSFFGSGSSNTCGGLQSATGSVLLTCTSEYIWTVSALGLTAGTYDAQYVIHDGDRNIGIGCVTITI